MNAENILAGTATLFMALGDKTRLRLLNLMRDREICVSSLTGTLGHSQPLISRHLAYLRNSGIVEARRDGKWMHYRISTDLDANTGRLLFELFKWMEDQEGLRADRQNNKETYSPVEIRTVPESKPKPERKSAPTPKPQPRSKPVRALPRESKRLDPTPEVYEYTPVHHNELEDFLL